MSREDPQLRVRIPAGLKADLEEKAKENMRTLTAEIVDRLETTLNQDALVQDSNGYNEFVSLYENMADEATYWKEKYEREYALDYADANKDELRSAVERLREVLNLPPKK
ncbi:Arc family DNA-binding protein [Serratia oryzae]|uniref:Arc-like DNA binding domain-containing protein n=1 Tax=Serratia oryzae TaxID=2034155 RepID=A0A1S8CP23_9GAMM|nr:Arc family DNA-binding protein [Serratia oryzae]OMQ26874.1 hypothetical protein BMI79_00665 [Serratia oryzae]